MSQIVLKAARALQYESALRPIAARLDAVGIPTMVLKGSLLQRRLYGHPSHHGSGDVDLLVSPSDKGGAVEVLMQAGFSFDQGNGTLWRLSRAATFVNGAHLRIDLHWGIHAGHLLAFCFRRLELELWRGPRRGEHGFLEPRPEPLYVFLAVHAAGHRLGRRVWTEQMAACAGLVRDWKEADRIATTAKVNRLVRYARLGVPGVVARDGAIGLAESGVTWFVRGHFIPEGIRSLSGSKAGL